VRGVKQTQHLGSLCGIRSTAVLFCTNVQAGSSLVLNADQHGKRQKAKREIKNAGVAGGGFTKMSLNFEPYKYRSPSKLTRVTPGILE
jgi:hypothetical protein